ncbi:MAG TPA: dihydrodipicolinate synthase family protein [Abditibacteriaceae bacterium]|nr:dihydrodipicolinate synthase family protein [Abditibacteriaceae bacterium]
MNQALHGVLPVLHMPYRDNYEIDFDTLQAEVDFAYECGAHGIVFALVSEVLRLTLEERRQVAEFLVGANRNRGSVTISVGAESSFIAVQLARHAESAGATALMAIPPVSVALGEDQLRAYYGTILDAVSIPVVVQDASAYIGQPMSVEFQASLLAGHGERVHFKPEAAPVGPVITALKAATQNRARIFEGSGGILLAENYRRGIEGTMPGTDLLDAVVALWRALEAGDEDWVYSISPLVGAILALAVGLDGYLALEKHLMVRRNIFKNELVRGPVGFTLDAAARAEADRLFDRLQAVL